MKNRTNYTDNQYTYNPQEGIVDYFESRLNSHHIDLGDDEDERSYQEDSEDSTTADTDADYEEGYRLMVSNHRDDFLRESGYDGF
jgi:hypothetical protein